MTTVCPSCGSTRNISGAIVCSSCNAPLPVSISSSINASLTLSGGRKYALSPTVATIIGSRGCAILLSGAGVEPQHARLTPSSGGFFIEPISGTVILNGKTVSTATPIPAGAIIKLGSQSLTYCGPDASAAPLALAPLKALTSPSMPKSAMVATLCSKTKKWFLVIFEEDDSGNWGAGQTSPITESRASKGYGYVPMKNVYTRGDYGKCPHCEDGILALCPKCQISNCLGSHGQENAGETIKKFFVCGKCGTKIYLVSGPVNLNARDDL